MQHQFQHPAPSRPGVVEAHGDGIFLSVRFRNERQPAAGFRERPGRAFVRKLQTDGILPVCVFDVRQVALQDNFACVEDADAVADALNVGKNMVEKRMAVCLPARARISRISRRPRGSSAEVGSSQMRSFGSPSRAWAMPRRCFMPREKPRMRRLAPSSPTIPSSFSVRSRMTAGFMPAICPQSFRYSRGVI